MLYLTHRKEDIDINRLIFSHNQVYQKDIGVLRYYNDGNYRLTHLKTVRQSGFEEIDPPPRAAKGAGGNPGRLAQNIAHTRARIYELAACNPWEHFVTLTFDAEKCDRTDLAKTASSLSKWLQNVNYRHGLNIRYLLVPEPHKKHGAWHMHGLMMGIPEKELIPFTLRDKIPKRIKDLLRDEHNMFNWPAYAEKFGFVTVEPIRDFQRCTRYITKYITKELLTTNREANQHAFYASLGLKRSEILVWAEIRHPFEPDFQNEYVRIKTFDNLEEPLQYFMEKEN